MQVGAVHLFWDQPLLSTSLCVPFSNPASPVATTDPQSSHLWLPGQCLTSHVAILICTICPHLASVLLILLHLASFKARSAQDG